MSKLFIVFEGIDLTLKSTTIETIKENSLLRSMIEFTREPFDKEKLKKNIKKYGEIEAFAMDRKESYKRLSKNKLNYIISDRSYISSMVYQSNDSITPERVLTENITIAPAIGKQKIDYVFYFTSTYEEYLKRLNSRENNDERDIYTKEEYEKMQEKYLKALNIVSGNKLVSNDIIIFDSTSPGFIKNVIDKLKLIIKDAIKIKWN